MSLSRVWHDICPENCLQDSRQEETQDRDHNLSSQPRVSSERGQSCSGEWFYLIFLNINYFQLCITSLCNISVELVPETGATTTGGEVETTSTTTTTATSPLCWQCCIRNTCHTTTTHCVYLCWLSWNHHLVQVSAGSVDRPRSAGDPGPSPWSPGVSACSVSDQYRGHQRYSSPH